MANRGGQAVDMVEWLGITELMQMSSELYERIKAAVSIGGCIGAILISLKGLILEILFCSDAVSVKFYALIKYLVSNNKGMDVETAAEMATIAILVYVILVEKKLSDMEELLARIEQETVFFKLNFG